MVITKERWQQAQVAERAQHTLSMAEGIAHYKKSYVNYAKYIGLHCVTGTCIEIGCADFPALQHWIPGYGIIVEPMPSPILEEIALHWGLRIIAKPVEEITLPTSDEIWLMNVIQHVIDPDLFIEKCKESAKIIRYFEPLYTGVCEYHPHTFTEHDFIRWFGKTNIYNDSLPGFHTATCAYGVWTKV